MSAAPLDVACDCPICLAPFDDHEVVPMVSAACGHSVCASCVASIAKKARKMKERKRGDGIPLCGICRVPSPKHVKNFELVALLPVLRQLQTQKLQHIPHPPPEATPADNNASRSNSMPAAGPNPDTHLDLIHIDPGRLSYQPTVQNALGPTPTTSSVFGGHFDGIPVAIKLIPRPDNRLEVDRKLTRAAHMRSPALLQFLGCSMPTDTPNPKILIVSELMAGSLRDSLDRNGAGFHADIGVPLAIQVVRGLNHMHAARVPHGNLKATNVLLTSTETFSPTEPTAKLTDSHLTLSGHLDGDFSHGGLPYLAPEVFENGTETTPLAADTYALGVLLWEISTPKLLTSWAHSDISDAFKAVVTRRERPGNPYLAIQANGYSREFADVVDACWRHNPVERPDMSAVLSRLTELASKDPNSPHSSLPPSENPWASSVPKRIPSVPKPVPLPAAVLRSSSAPNPDNLRAIICELSSDKRSAEQILSIIRDPAYGKCNDVHRVACHALSRSPVLRLPVEHKERRKLVALNIVPTLLSSLKAWPADIMLAGPCLFTIGHILAGDDASRLAFVRAEGVALLHNTMYTHSLVADIQEKGCYVTCQLSGFVGSDCCTPCRTLANSTGTEWVLSAKCKSRPFRSACCSQGVLADVVYALERRQQKDEVCLQALCALRNLSLEQADNANAAASLKVIPSLENLLERQQFSGRIFQAVSALLSGSAVRQEVVRRPKLLHLLERTLAKHPTDYTVQRFGTKAILCLLELPTEQIGPVALQYRFVKHSVAACENSTTDASPKQALKCIYAMATSHDELRKALIPLEPLKMLLGKMSTSKDPSVRVLALKTIPFIVPSDTKTIRETSKAIKRFQATQLRDSQLYRTCTDVLKELKKPNNG